MIRIRATSTEYVRVRVSAREAGVPLDPTGSAVAMAFEETDVAPAAADDVWETASWDTATGVYRAQCLVGPGGVELEAGRYFVFVKVTDSPEIPIMAADVLEVVA